MEAAVKRLSEAIDSHAASAAWIDFIYAANSFYSILEQASKTSRKEMAWFGRLKSVRKSDPLLRYIHQARNAEEHGCELVSAAASSRITLAEQGAEVSLVARDGHWVAQDVKGKVMFPQDTIRLIRVRSPKFEDTFDPPTEHLGRSIDDASAWNVATLALRYLTGVFAEAKTIAI